MVHAKAFIKITRPVNVVMSALTVLLGAWCAGSSLSTGALVLLVCAAGCAVGFGNCINDIIDIEGDRINHPRRPLPSGEIQPGAAVIFSSILAILSLAAAAFVRPVFACATLPPLLLLFAYARYFKQTPLVGNAIVSILVAYPLIYGGLGAPRLYHLWIPATLAFILNFNREIIKDLEDEQGDRAVGTRTTAAIPPPVLRTLLIVLGAGYGVLLYIPALLGHFGPAYILLCTLVTLPLHLYWLPAMFRPDWRMHLSRMSKIIKLEMLGGLIALAVDCAVRSMA